LHTPPGGGGEHGVEISSEGEAVTNDDDPNDVKLPGPGSPEEFQEMVAEVASVAWESAGKQAGNALDFWLAAERYVRGMTAMVARAPWWPFLDEDAFARMRESSAVYFMRIRQLAHLMWQTGGEQCGTPLDIWLAAERHILVVMAAAIRTTGSAPGAGAALARAFRTFSPAAHLERIRQTAYVLWEETGRQGGHALDNWLDAEEEVLNNLMDGTAKTVELMAKGKPASDRRSKPSETSPE
jgi:hypothetical protein